MLNETYKNVTEEYAPASKSQLILQNHPIIRELRQIHSILMGEDADSIVHQDGIISLKELFQKKNMDLYHVDCLILCRIARNVLILQEQLRQRKIFPGLYDLNDIYVNFPEQCDVYITHPEKFQLLKMEQDYEWYPEDERIFGDRILFDEEAQKIADQRLLYKILVASPKGNVKLPPKSNSQDYSSLFYGTLPSKLKEVFEKNEILSHAEWENYLDEWIRSEEYYEKKAEKKDQKFDNQPEAEVLVDQNKQEYRVKSLFVILRTECRNSLEISRLLYKLHDEIEIQQSHGRFLQEQGYLFGDKIIEKKEFALRESNYRVHIPQVIKEYSIVEALLMACEWMWEILEKYRKNMELQKNSDASYGPEKMVEHRMYIVSDGKIENNTMFKECLKRISLLANSGCDIYPIISGTASCEGWTNLKEQLAKQTHTV